MTHASRVLVEELLQKLAAKRQTFSLAESCTCGNLSAAFAYRSGLSEMFLGGVVSYANSVKENILGVSPDSLKSYGAVSSVVALEMARGIRATTKSDWGISVTGIAGPTGGTKEKPVGLVYFGIVGPQIEEYRQQNFFGERTQIQQAATEFALRLFLEKLF